MTAFEERIIREWALADARAVVAEAAQHGQQFAGFLDAMFGDIHLDRRLEEWRRQWCCGRA